MFMATYLFGKIVLYWMRGITLMFAPLYDVRYEHMALPPIPIFNINFAVDIGSSIHDIIYNMQFIYNV